MILQILLTAIFLTHGIEEHHSWDESLRSFDIQIERLEKIADQYQNKANEMELAAQPLALRDWPAYAKAMEEAESYGRLAIQTRRKKEDLKKEKELLIQKHHESHDKQQHLSYL